MADTYFFPSEGKQISVFSQTSMGGAVIKEKTMESN